MLTQLGTDVRVAVRGLLRTSSFTAVTIATLALGIGAVTAIFAVVNGVLIKPLPFDDQDTLVSVAHMAPGIGIDDVGLSTAMALTYRDSQQAFEDIGFWNAQQTSITGRGNPERVPALQVTAAILPILRTETVVGRRFTTQDDAPGAPETAILGHAYWLSRFASDPAVLGSTVRVDGIDREIIGVLPPDFRLAPQDISIYVPLKLDPADLSPAWLYRSVARLRPGTTIDQAYDELSRLLRTVPEQHPAAVLSVQTIERTQLGPNLRPLKDDFVGDIGNVLWVIFGTVGCILLIACANVSNLYLVRAEGRSQEIAVRTVIGAGRSRIARQLLVESLLLGLLGGLAGLGLALAGLRLLIWMAPVTVPRLYEIGIGPTVLLFALGVALFSSVLFGLFAVFRAIGLDLVASLKEGGRGAGISRKRQRARHLLVVAQTALALVLLTGSGLMIRSFQSLRDVNPGFANSEEVLTFRVDIPEAEIAGNANLPLAYEQIWRGLRGIPGVASVGASTSVTMGGGALATILVVEDFPLAPDDGGVTRRFKWTTAEYFSTMQNPVVAGRAIDWADIHESRNIAVLTANLAEEYWGSPAAALGKRVRFSAQGNPWLEVVGVVGDVHDLGVTQDASQVVYLPLAPTTRSLTFAIRSNLPTEGLVTQARAVVEAVNPNLPLANIRMLDEILARSMARTSFTLIMLTIAATVALALGLVGLYGVVSYIVSQRTREIGVRMALGASGTTVSRMVLRQGMVLAGLGVAVGLVAAIGLSHLMSALLYGVEATDPVAYSVAATLLVVVALVATYLPAARASRTDPLVALRFE